MDKKSISCLFLAIAVAITSIGCSNQNDNTGSKLEVVNIAYLPVIQDLPIFVAVEEKL